MIRVGGVLLALASALGPAALVGGAAVAFAAGIAWVPAVEQRTGPVCHHQAERTLRVGDAPLPVCARCTGLYVGAALGGLAGGVTPLRPRWVRRAGLAAAWAVGVGLVAAILEAAGLIATPNGLRLALGMLLGFGVPLVGALGGRLVARHGAV